MRRCARGSAVWGVVLIGAGLLLLVLSLPCWLWVAALGLLLTAIGFILWRFDG